MKFNQIESFVKIAETGSFSRTAKELFLTQPTVTAHIQSLEKYYGVKLFARTTKEVVLTEDGKELYDYAKQILILQEKMENLFHDRQEETVKSFVIAASSIPVQCILPGLLEKFSEKYPKSCFQIQEMDSSKVVNAVADRLIDLGFTGTVIEKPYCRFVPVCKDNLVIITPNTEKYRDIKLKEKGISWITGEQLIMREEGSGTRREAEKQLLKAEIDKDQLNVLAVIENSQVIKRLVKSGMGISIISKSVVEDDIKEGTMIDFPLSSRGSNRTLYMVYNNSYPLSGNAKKMIKLVREIYQL